jgi:hypothetical protein
MKNKTVYHDIGYLMAESLGLVSEEIKQVEKLPPPKKKGELSAEAQKKRDAETPEQRKARLAAAKKLRANNAENMGDALARDRRMLRKRAGASGDETAAD